MNRTLNECARSMRLHVGLSKTFWADAISTAADLINQGPSVPMEFRLPEEVWSGKEVDLSTPVAKVRRSSRNIRLPQRYSPILNYLLLTDGGEPKCYDEALQDENSSKNLHLEQLDVKTTFLHGDLEEDLYMIQPKWFIVQG
ncbi:Retrovirus-related Pol polyprotein from transposon TNT 1-94 [Vitis vinifera]|uniref:Retrovirus-related Pol polyprotein from transposon TNT 1-94 n=1 Tax=Vitis vinifera TaxID=29760 RepID=A0A438F0S8_VITVI|nr:Retrovirus-related Pol polyprotein from transposon TNT 1-94 [Vitis vinifera]